MILCNSLIIVPRHFKKIGILIYDNLQAQELMELNNKRYNNIYNIKDIIRNEGFVFEADGHQGKSRWYLKTEDITFTNQLKFHHRFNTTYYLNELDHYRICPNCMAAIPETWVRGCRCKEKK